MPSIVLESSTNSLNQTQYYSYDANSNLISFHDGDIPIYYEYDELSRQTQIRYPDQSYSYYQYDQSSNLIAAWDSRGWSYFSYDALSRLTSQSQPNGDTVNHEYNAAGDRIRLTADQNVYYSYDALGNLVQLQIGTVSLGYGLQPYGNSPYGGSGASTYYHYNAEQNIISKKLPQ